MRKLPAQPANGLIDGLRLLQELAVRDEPVSCSELAGEMGVETTRMNRLLKTLAYMGLADRTGDRRYQVGPGIHVLAAQAIGKSKLLRVAAPALDSAKAPDCIKALGVLWLDKVSYLFHKSPRAGMLESLGGHSAFPATISSLGMALLARQDDAEIDALYGGRSKLPGFASMKALKKELEATRLRGFGRLETAPGTISMAYVVGKAPGLAAIALSGPMDAASEERNRASLESIANDIDEELSK